MRWVEKLLDQLDGSIEWQSLGTLAWRYSEEEGWLLIAPSPLEIVGGAEDGESVFPFYSLHISILIEIFDELPTMLWDSMRNELSIEGKIDGSDAWITFCREPFEDDEPQDILDPDGSMRKKQPPAE